MLDEAIQKKRNEEPEPIEKSNAEINLENGEMHGFKLKSALGNKFLRAGAGKDPAYLQLEGHYEKNEWRKNWARIKLKEIRERREKAELYSEVDEDKGTYLPLSLLFWEEGQMGHRPATRCGGCQSVLSALF